MCKDLKVSTGLKQGDSLSPTSFNLALKKALKEIQMDHNIKHGKDRGSDRPQCLKVLYLWII